MPYTPVRDIELIEIGSLGKETLSNDAFVNFSRGISGTATIPLTGPTYTLTDAEAQAFVLIVTGALTAHVSLTVPADSRVYIVDNRTTGAFNVSLFPSAGGGVAALQGERTLVYCDGVNVYPVASGSGGGGSGAPTDASYLVGAAHALLSAERVVTDTATVTWDLATAAQAKAQVPDDAITFAKMQPIAAGRLLGRYTAGPGDVQELTLSTGLAVDGSGNLTATATGQPLDATLTAIAALGTAADRLLYFTGVDAAALATLTAYARTLLAAVDAAAARTTLALVPGANVQAYDATLQAIAGLAPGANQMIFFTGPDTASLTQITTFMRGLLDDNNAAQARATLGITSGGAPLIPFTALTDVPTSYTGQGGKTVAVNGAATGLEFIATASGSYQPLDATLTALAALATVANTAIVFTGTDTAVLMTVTPYARTLVDDPDAATARATLGLAPGTDVQAYDATLAALAGVTTGVDLLPFFTGVDTAAATVLTGFMRTLLDDADAAEAQATLGITGGVSTFLGLSDTPDAYATHALEGVRVNAAATALEFAALSAGVTTLLGLTDVPDSYTGQALKAVTVKSDETGVEFTTVLSGAQPYDLGVSWSGVLPASQVLMRYPFPRAADFPAGLVGLRGVAAVAATASTTLTMQKNGSTVGTAVWAAAGTTATFTMASATSFAAGDILTIVAPASPDATLADIGLALAGTRS